MRWTLRMITIAAIAMLGCGMASAQDPFVGTWKLNIEKSKFAAGPAPKNVTSIVEAQGSGEKYTVQGVAGDGSAIGYTYTTNLDGKPAPISGTGVLGGADTVAVTRMDSRTYSAVTSKSGKVIARTRVVVSADGKVITQTRRSTDSNGKMATGVTIWEKQ